MAGLFLLTSVTLSILVIVQMTSGSNNTATQPAANCTFSGTIAEPTLPAPSSYKAGKVSTLTATDLVTGTGAAAVAGKCLTVKYYGTLATTGVEFDQDFTQPFGLEFAIGQGEVIPGWDQGLIGMKVGGTRRLAIPAALAYGSQAQGSIPANSDLVFVVKLLSVQ